MARNENLRYDNSTYQLRAYKGPFETIAKLRYDIPLGESGDFAFLEDTESFVYWNKTAKDWKNVDYVSDLNGSNYVMVYGTGTPDENGAEFLAAYNLAKTMPRYIGSIDTTTDDIVTVYKGQVWDDTDNTGDFKIATNTIINGPANTITGTTVSQKYAQSLRTTMLIAPGYYNFATEFVHNQSGIDIKSLSGDSDVFISSTTKNGNYSFGVATGYTKVSGINTVDALTKSSIRLAPNLQFGVVLEKCISDIYSYWDGDVAHNYTYYGTLIDCIGDNYSFVSGNGGQTLSGKFVRCKADNFSFGYNAIIANATFENCTGKEYCFGSTDGEYSSSIGPESKFKNCTASDLSFGCNTSENYGKYVFCINEGDDTGLFNTNASNLYCSKNGELP